jgi:hypothetical protein
MTSNGSYLFCKTKVSTPGISVIGIVDEIPKNFNKNLEYYKYVYFSNEKLFVMESYLDKNTARINNNFIGPNTYAITIDQFKALIINTNDHFDKKKENKEEYGYIYCMTKESTPDIFNIGFTTDTPLTLLKKANNSTRKKTKGMRFKLGFYKYVSFPREKMYAIKKQLKQKTSGMNKNFTRPDTYAINIRDFKDLFADVDDYYDSSDTSSGTDCEGI